MPFTVELARSAPDDVAARAVGVTKGDLTGDGVDWEFLRAQGFEGKKGEVRALPGSEGGAVFAVGLGPADEVDAGVLCHAAGALARAAKKLPS
ncbi:MAG TPA: M17 family peptidase N-terminal domain-containing protein, partial [Acidimicrobiales bacterium]|nr:M17 family peptidase N-terminal domain-containing protein [Acidimicrobiales bacterium]